MAFEQLEVVDDGERRWATRENDRDGAEDAATGRRLVPSD
jgi:hypothetical protein